MAVKGGCLLYGCTGYSGKGTARHLKALGAEFTVAGRDELKVKAVAEDLGVNYEVFDLSDSEIIESVVSKYSILLNCAGPVLRTYRPLVDACLNTETHYLDISAEVDLYEDLATYHDQAKDAGIMLLPAIGMDMVPGDCLALMLKERLPDASELNMAYKVDGSLSRGSLRVGLESFKPTITVRRDGRLTQLDEPIMRTIDFGSISDGRPVETFSSTFGDISTAWYSTGIPNITSYIHFGGGFAVLQGLESEEDILNLPEGPTDEELQTDRACVYGEAKNACGDTVAARLVTPHGYLTTFIFAADITHRVINGAVELGYKTPAQLFGSDYISEFESQGFSLEWLK